MPGSLERLAAVMTSTDPQRPQRARPLSEPLSTQPSAAPSGAAGAQPSGAANAQPSGAPGTGSARLQTGPTRPPRPAAALGRYGEALAVRYLREQGMEVLDRNWRCEHGEVDVVALDGDCLVICEVKTRRSSGFGEPVEAVTFAKAKRLRRLSAAYLADKGGGSRVAQVRVDVVGILCLPGRPALVRHVIGVGS